MESVRLNHTKYDITSQKSKGICRALGATGVMNVDDAKKKFGADALKDLLDKKVIKSFNSFSEGSCKTVIHLSEKGKTYTRKHLTYGSLYSWNRMQLKHDLKLNKIYLSLTKEEQRSWQNESQIRKFSDGKIRGIDGSYVRSDGSKVAVEVVTKNYPASKLQEKIKTIKEHFDDVEVKLA